MNGQRIENDGNGIKSQCSMICDCGTMRCSRPSRHGGWHEYTEPAVECDGINVPAGLGESMERVRQAIYGDPQQHVTLEDADTIYTALCLFIAPAPGASHA